MSKIDTLSTGIFCGSTMPENFDLKSLLLFNNRVIMPTTYDARLNMYSYLSYVWADNEEVKNETLNRFILDEFYYNDMAPIVWLIQVDPTFHDIIVNRLIKQNINWKSLLRKWYSPSFNEKCSDEDCFSHVIAETKRLFVSAVIAHQRNASVVCSGPQCDISYLPIFGEIKDPLFENFSSYPAEAMENKNQFLKNIINFTQQNQNGFLPNVSGINFPDVVHKEIPMIRKLSLEQILRLKITDKVQSLYHWIMDRAEIKKFNATRATSNDIADFMQESLWEIVVKVEPNIPTETVKVALSNIPGLPINPVSLYFGVSDIADKMKMKREFHGLFIISNIYKLISQK